MTARAPLCKVLNLRFNCLRLLYGFGFRTPSDECPLVGQQGDQGSDNEHRAADPDPRREWVIKCLDNSLLAIGCRRCEYNIDVASVEVVRTVVNSDDTQRLRFGAGFVDAAFRLQVCDFRAVFEKT